MKLPTSGPKEGAINTNDVQLSEFFQQEFVRKFGIQPNKVMETLTSPDKTDDLAFHGSALMIHTKRFDSAQDPCTLLVIESSRDNERSVSSAFKVYPELGNDLHELRPLEVLRLLTDSFGLLVRVGKQVGKLILRESFQADKEHEVELVQGLESPRGSMIQEIYFKFDEGELRTYYFALAFCIESEMYSAWLASVAKRFQQPKKQSQTRSQAPADEEGSLSCVVVARKGADLRPHVEESLKLIPSEMLYHAALKLRHPAGLYHISLERLAFRFEEALGSLEGLSSKFSPVADPPNIDHAMEHTENLLRSVAEHLEDCKNILLSLFPNIAAAKPSREFKEFTRLMEPYRDQVARIVNAIKHRGGRVRPVFMHWGVTFAPGYFIEGESEGGIIGPDPNIHAGGDTAMSLFRDLKLHFVHVYLVGSLLEQAVSGIIPTARFSAEARTEREAQFRYRELARRISLLPNIVYPDEVLLPYPLIRLLRADDFGSEAEFSYARGKSRLETFKKFKMTVSWEGGGIADTFKVPYMRTGWENGVAKAKNYK